MVPKETKCPAHSGIQWAVGVTGAVVAACILGVGGLMWKMNEGISEIRGATSQIISTMQDARTDAHGAVTEARKAVIDAQTAAVEARAHAEAMRKARVQ